MRPATGVVGHILGGLWLVACGLWLQLHKGRRGGGGGGVT
jgi:hypothetical protein